MCRLGPSITDVSDPSLAPGASGSMVSMWRFDPDAAQLRVTLAPAQSRPLSCWFGRKSHRPLPFDAPAGFGASRRAGKQTGLLGNRHGQ